MILIISIFNTYKNYKQLLWTYKIIVNFVKLNYEILLCNKVKEIILNTLILFTFNHMQKLFQGF